MNAGRRGRLLGPARKALGAWLVARADRANRDRAWGRAERLYAQALALQPDMAPVLVQYGHALKEQGFPHRAAAAYRRAAALDGRTTDAWAQLGHLLEILGKPADAAAAFGAALDADRPALSLRDDRARALVASRIAVPSERQALAALLEAHDLPPAVLTLIDAPFYRAADPTLASAELWGLIDHFGRFGVDTLLPLNPRAAFDPDFYRATYSGVRLLAPSRAYRHWLTLGTRLGWAPNRTAWLEGLFAPSLRRLDDAARGFAEAALAFEATRPMDRVPFAWLAEEDRPPLPPLPTEREAAVWLMFAAGLIRAGLDQPGDRLRQAAVRRWPVETRATDAGPADRLDAGADRRHWVGADFADRADAQQAAGDWHGAVATLGAGVRALPQDADLRRRRDEVADRAIRAAWDAAEREAEAGRGLAAARANLKAMLDAVVEAVPQPPPLPRRAITRVAIVGNTHLPQCRFYRIDQKLEQLRRAGYDAEFFDETSEMRPFFAQMVGFQAVVFFRVPAHFHIIDAAIAARALGLATIYEIDDLLFDAEHYPAPIESYGGDITPAEHRGLSLGVPMFAAAMALCDFGLASTEALAAAMRPHVRTGQVFVHPNALSSAHALVLAPAPPDRPEGRVTIFYGSNTTAHKEDVRALVEPALAHLVARHGSSVSILLVGPVPLTPGLRALGASVTILDAMPLESYWTLLRTVDIVVVPLFRSPATDAKSGIKWLEAALAGVPTVASRTTTTEDLIEDGLNGFLCDTASDWTSVLDRLVGDTDLRRAVGARARADALARFSPEQAATNLRSLLVALSPPALAPKPTIAIVNVFYPPQKVGGATRVVHDNVLDLRDRHGDVFDIAVFATMIEDGEPCRMRSAPQDGIPVTTVTAPGSDRDMAPDDAAMGRAFGTFLDATRPHLVHFHCVLRLTASVVDEALRRGIPYVITLHDGWWFSTYLFMLDDALALEVYDYGEPLETLRRHGRPAFERLLRLAPPLFGARAVLSVSAAFAAVAAASRVPNLMTLTNGVSPLPVVARRPDPDGTIRLGYLGGCYPHKGWPLIQEVLSDLDTGRLSLLVIDHAMEAHERRRERWGALNVEFRGKCPAAEVGELYAGIDVLLAPSLWPESFGLVTREALQCGCWVVASDRGAMADDVRDGVNGFVIDVSSPAALRDALLRIAADPDRFRRSPPPSGRLRTAQDQADDLAVLYRSILASPTGEIDITRKDGSRRNPAS